MSRLKPDFAPDSMRTPPKRGQPRSGRGLKTGLGGLGQIFLQVSRQEHTKGMQIHTTLSMQALIKMSAP